MIFKLREAALYYGTSKYPLADLPASINEVEFAALPDDVVNECCKIVALRSGMFRSCHAEEGARYYAGQVRHNVATAEQRVPVGVEDDGSTKELVIPATVQLLGNGFSFIWEVA